MTVKQLGGKKATARSQDPALQFDLRTRHGDANIKSVAVTLPKAFAIDQRHLGNICSKAQLASERCAGRQAIGTATTTTPLLDAPLSGPAYAVSGFGKLPHVVFILDGQVTIMPEAESSSVKGGHLRTVVPVVPDAPIGHFRLETLRRQEGLSGQHPEPLRLGLADDGRIRGPEREKADPAGERRRPPAAGRQGRQAQAAAGLGADSENPGERRRARIPPGF